MLVWYQTILACGLEGGLQRPRLGIVVLDRVEERLHQSVGLDRTRHPGIYFDLLTLAYTVLVVLLFRQREKQCAIHGRTTPCERFYFSPSKINTFSPCDDNFLLVTYQH